MLAQSGDCDYGIERKSFGSFSSLLATVSFRNLATTELK